MEDLRIPIRLPKEMPPMVDFLSLFQGFETANFCEDFVRFVVVTKSKRFFRSGVQSCLLSRLAKEEVLCGLLEDHRRAHPP